jgi:hypothetical protein
MRALFEANGKDKMGLYKSINELKEELSASHIEILSSKN